MSLRAAMASAGCCSGAGQAMIPRRAMAGVYTVIRAFVLEHKGCGELRGNAEPLTPEGYAVWLSCGCGARLEQWVSPADAEADLLRSTLLAFEN